jgi:hypothetical protein
MPTVLFLIQITAKFILYQLIYYLSTFTNQVSFAFNGVRYDLYKFGNGRFATVDGEVRLIKKE